MSSWPAKVKCGAASFSLAGKAIYSLFKLLSKIHSNFIHSLMVEELARWKASLTAKNARLIEANKQMLQTLSTARDLQIETWTNLKFLCGQRDANLQSSNVLDLTAECVNISQQLVLHSGIGMPAAISLVGLDKSTVAEKLAVQVRGILQDTPT